jgi:hypothetical protein
MRDRFASYGADEPPRRGSGMAITALAIGIVAVLLSWVPTVNNVVFVLGFGGLVVAVVAWSGAKTGTARGGALATAAIALSVAAIVGVITTQWHYSSMVDETAVEDEQGDDSRAHWKVRVG